MFLGLRQGKSRPFFMRSGGKIGERKCQVGTSGLTSILMSCKLVWISCHAGNGEYLVVYVQFKTFCILFVGERSQMIKKEVHSFFHGFPFILLFA